MSGRHRKPSAPIWTPPWRPIAAPQRRGRYLGNPVWIEADPETRESVWIEPHDESGGRPMCSEHDQLAPHARGGIVPWDEADELCRAHVAEHRAKR